MCSLNPVGVSSHASPVGRSGESTPKKVESFPLLDMEIIVGKNLNGSTGTCKVEFDPPVGRFGDLFNT